MTEHDCNARAKEFTATAEKPYRYVDSGLSNVYLIGIKYRVCGTCRQQSAEIPAVEQLFSTIAEAIVMKSGRLTGEEIRFLRKHLGKRAADFASLINKTPEHYSKLENDQLPVPEDTDKLIRFTCGTLSGNQHLIQQIMHGAESWLNSIQTRQNAKIQIKKAQRGRPWIPEMRAA